MIDFIVDLFVEIGEFFAELWVNKIIGNRRSKKKKPEDSDKPLVQ